MEKQSQTRPIVIQKLRKKVCPWSESRSETTCKETGAIGQELGGIRENHPLMGKTVPNKAYGDKKITEKGVSSIYWA
jgi:hypothetical protein